MTLQKIIMVMVISGAVVSSSPEYTPQKRRPFHIPLPLITLLFDGDNSFEEAFVTFGGSGEGWAIGTVTDRYVKDTKKERVDHFYREMVTGSYYLSPFEAGVLERVSKKFEETLIIYEKDLKNGNWDRLLYLDGYFPSYFRGFFYLYCAAHNSFSALPKVTRISDTLYEESINSYKTDQRVQIWQDNPEHVVKLRIATKELLYQMKEWRTKSLDVTELDLRHDKSKKFRETYELFIRLYFNLPPASVIRKKIF
jgi:hypothetical protein